MSILGPCLRSNWTERRLIFCRAGGTQSHALLCVRLRLCCYFLLDSCRQRRRFALALCIRVSPNVSPYMVCCFEFTAS